MANGRNKYDEPLTTQRVNEKRLTRVTWILALAQLVVIGAMVALMFTPFVGERSSCYANENDNGILRDIPKAPAC